MSHDPSIADDHEASARDHTHSGTTGPVADASARIARLNDASAVGLVQAAVWRSAYGKVLPQAVVELFEGLAMPGPFSQPLADGHALDDPNCPAARKTLAGSTSVAPPAARASLGSSFTVSSR